jgi:hypothetical protein
MNEYIRLGFDGIINLMMAMSKRQAPYPRFQIEVFPALKVIKVTAFAFDDIRECQRMSITPKDVIHKL